SAELEGHEEIEITPEMVEAGAEVIWRRVSGRSAPARRRTTAEAAARSSQTGPDASATIAPPSPPAGPSDAPHPPSRRFAARQETTRASARAHRPSSACPQAPPAAVEPLVFRPAGAPGRGSPLAPSRDRAPRPGSSGRPASAGTGSPAGDGASLPAHPRAFSPPT